MVLCSTECMFWGDRFGNDEEDIECEREVYGEGTIEQGHGAARVIDNDATEDWTDGDSEEEDTLYIREGNRSALRSRTVCNIGVCSSHGSREAAKYTIEYCADEKEFDAEVFPKLGHEDHDTIVEHGST